MRAVSTWGPVMAKKTPSSEDGKCRDEELEARSQPDTQQLSAAKAINVTAATALTGIQGTRNCT